MNVAIAVDDGMRHEAGSSASEAGPAPKRIVVGFGFWVFLLSDIVMFAAFFAVVTGFALIWHIWWMAGAGAIGIFLTMLAFAFRNEEEIEIPADQIARFEQANPVEIAV